MKNIHLLPTKEPSNIYKSDNGLFITKEKYISTYREYKNINEAWEEYKSQIREPFANLKQIERVFRDGYMIGYDKKLSSLK